MSGIIDTWKAGRVLRLNMSSEINMAYAKELEVVDLPTFVLFDSSGKLLRRWIQETPTLAALAASIQNKVE